jgi:hypothetical protein
MNMATTAVHVAPSISPASADREVMIHCQAGTGEQGYKRDLIHILLAISHAQHTERKLTIAIAEVYILIRLIPINVRGNHTTSMKATTPPTIHKTIRSFVL